MKLVNETDYKRLAEIGSRIRRVRQDCRLNLTELARLSGISAPALSLIETGKRDLRVTSLCRIAAALRCNAGDLLEDRPTDIRASDPREGEGYDLGDYT